MERDHLPDVACWRHHGARSGFEVLFSSAVDDGHVLRGHTTAVEADVAWAVGFRLELDERWRTVRAVATSSTADGEHRTVVERIDGNRWLIDGYLRPDLAGCLDVDVESSVATNALPVRRVPFVPGGARRSVPAVLVRAGDLRVERIEQEYVPLDRTRDGFRFGYESVTFDVAITLTYDAAGLILDYPGLAERAR